MGVTGGKENDPILITDSLMCIKGEIHTNIICNLISLGQALCVYWVGGAGGVGEISPGP